MNSSKSIRVAGAIKLAGFTVISALAWQLLYWVTSHWDIIPIGASIPIVGLPGALAIVGLLELLTGLPGLEIAARLNQLPRWQQRVIWALFFCLAIAALLFALVAFG